MVGGLLQDLSVDWSSVVGGRWSVCGQWFCNTPPAMLEKVLCINVLELLVTLIGCGYSKESNEMKLSRGTH